MKEPFDELSKMLDEVALSANTAVKKLDSVKTIDELLTPEFMCKHNMNDPFNYGWI